MEIGIIGGLMVGGLLTAALIDFIPGLILIGIGFLYVGYKAIREER